jgi:RNA polymerase sigma-70 factor (ECF subfamily)
MFTRAGKKLPPLADPVSGTETELLEKVALGSENAFRELFHRYADLLHTFIYQLTKSRELAEEVVQDIFLQIWTSRETLTGIRHFRNYLFVISRNNAFNALKKMVRERNRQKEWEKIQDFQYPAEGAAQIEPQLSLIEEAISRLPPQQQKVWLLSRRQGKKYSEIAAEMNLSKETVKKYMQYATASIMEYVLARLDLLLIGLLLLPY